MARDPERSTWWEREHSWWLVLIALSLSFRTWAAFGYIWMRTRVRSWLVAAVGYLVLLLVAFYFLSFDDDSWQVGFGAVALPGFTVEVGRRIVEVWEKIDDFDNVDDFARMLDLPPRLVDRIAIG